MTGRRRGGTSRARQRRRAARFGALVEARQQGCRCRAIAKIVGEHDGMLEVEVDHEAGCDVVMEEKDAQSQES